MLEYHKRICYKVPEHLGLCNKVPKFYEFQWIVSWTTPGLINIKTIPVRTENSFVVTRDLLECTCLIDNELIESINCKNGKYFNEQAVWMAV